VGGGVCLSGPSIFTFSLALSAPLLDNQFHDLRLPIPLPMIVLFRTWMTYETNRRVLSPSMREYAAADAWATMVIFEHVSHEEMMMR
jgi:hypothetical protein